MHDHDQRFKNLIQLFFEPFLRLFFVEWAERLDCARVEWLEQEVFHEPPEGGRSILDLVAKLPARQEVPGHAPTETGEWLALVHIEIETPDNVASLRPYMFESYVTLRRRYRLPVLPIGLYLKVGLEGIGIDVYEEHFWELQPIRFQYLYVGLPALDGVKYVQGDNWLGVALAALVKIPPDQVAWLGAEALRRIQEGAALDQQRFCLGECVDAYLPLDPAMKAEFDKLLVSKKYEGVQAMNKTWFEKGREEGIEVSRQMLRGLLEERFGPLSESAIKHLHQISAIELTSISKGILRASSLKDLGFDQ